MPRLGGKVRKKQQIDFDEDQWSCTVCTYQNKVGAYKCQICEAPRGSSTRKGGRIAEQIIQKQQQTQLFAQYGDGSTSTIEAGLKPRGGMEEVRRKSMVDSNGASGSHVNGNLSEDDDESISEQSSIASDTRPASRLSGRRQYSRKPSESEESVEVESKSRGPKRKPKNEKRKRGRKKKEEESSEEEQIIRKTPAKRPRGRPRQETSESEGDIPESPNTSTSQPAKKRSKTPKRQENTMQKMLARKIHSKLALLGKHENIDRSSGVDFTVTYGGTSFVVTEYKTKAPSPESAEKVTVKTENGESENKAHENSSKSSENSNGVASEKEVKCEKGEDEPGPSRSTDPPANLEDEAAPAEVDAKQIASVNAKIQKLSSKLHQKQNKPPSLEEKFKNAFKNTDPKNPPKISTEMSKQLETTKEVKEHLQRSKQKTSTELEKNESDAAKDLSQKENLQTAKPQPKQENSTNGNVPVPVSPPTPKKVPPQMIPTSSPSQSPVQIARQPPLTSPIKPPHPRYVTPTPTSQPGSSPSPRMSSQNISQPSVTHPSHTSHHAPPTSSHQPQPPKTQQPIRGIPLGKPIEIKKGGNRPPPASPTLSRPIVNQSGMSTSPGHLARPIMGAGPRPGGMQNQMVRPGMAQGGPRPMRPSFNPAGRPGLSPGSSNSPRQHHPHAPMRGPGPMRPDMKRGPRPVQPGQRMQMRPQRPNFPGAAPGPSGRPNMPPQSRPGMQGPGIRHGRPEGAAAPIRAVQSPSPRAPLNPQARPQGLKPIRGLPIGASVKIKTNVKVPNKPAAPQTVPPVKPDHPAQKTESPPDPSKNALQQNEAAKAPESQNSAANNQPTETESHSSKSSIAANNETKTEESAPPENPPPAKELPKPPPPENDSSEDELQIDESVEPDAVG